MILPTKYTNNTFIYMYSYCKDCGCWHSKYDNCADIQKDKASKNKN